MGQRRVIDMALIVLAGSPNLIRERHCGVTTSEVSRTLRWSPRTVPRFSALVGEVMRCFFELTISVHAVVDVGLPGHWS